MTYEVASTELRTHSIGSHWGWFLALGLVFVVGGAFAVFAPLATTLVLTIFVAAVFAVSGILQVLQAFRTRSWVGFAFELLIGILMVVVGVSIWMQPVIGALALTIVVGAAFLAEGIAQIMLGFRVRPHGGWGWLVASGVVAILVGLMILVQWPNSALVTLGILAGVSLMFTGWGWVALALAARAVRG